MSSTFKIFALAACLLAAAACADGIGRSARGSPFTTFVEDEDVCRKAGTAAIGGASGSSAEQRYDFAYRRCMVIHGRMRQMGIPPQGEPPTAGFAEGNPHSFDYPDAFYSVPYATPGYGYDGFGY